MLRGKGAGWADTGLWQRGPLEDHVKGLTLGGSRERLRSRAKCLLRKPGNRCREAASQQEETLPEPFGAMLPSDFTMSFLPRSKQKEFPAVDLNRLS